MNNDRNNLRMMLREALDNMWSRIRSLFGGMDDRVTALEQGGGTPGPQGPKGDKGDKGDTGPQGPKGDPGDPATNIITSVNGKTGAVVLDAADVGAKATQSPVADPTASGTAVAFIDSITQNAQGVILPTKKTVPNATTTDQGLMSATDKAKLDDANACAQVGPSAVASFTDAYAADALGVAVDITPVQSGSGDPSPDNVRPISGWTGAKVTVSPTQDAQDGTTYDITFPTEVGTVYGGKLDVTNGTLVVEYAKKTFDGRQTITKNMDSEMRYYNVMFADGDFSSDNKVVSSWLKKSSETKDENPSFHQSYRTGNHNIYFENLNKIDETLVTADAVRTYFANNPLEVIYKLANPITYQFLPTQIALLAGMNNVWADCGDVTVGYLRADSLCINRAIAARLKDGGDVNVIESISVNGTNIPPDANKNVNLTVPTYVRVDATILQGSYFDVPNLEGCTSNSCVFFQPLTDGNITGSYIIYLQPAIGHCLVYVRNPDGTFVSTGTRILGCLFYK